MMDRTIVIGIDPGTRTAGICVLMQDEEERWQPQYLAEIVRETADALEMAEEIIRAVGPWMGYRFRDRQVLIVVEDYRPRTGQSGAAARVLEVIGVLRYVLRGNGCRVELRQHGEWRARWMEGVMRRIAAGERSAPEWMENLGDHELDAARMAWAVATTRPAAGVEE